MKLATLLLIVTLVLSPPGKKAALRKSDPVITEITLERSECLGPCPAYKIILHPDGTITYIGDSNVERIGTFVGTGNIRDFRHTVELIRTSHFDQFKAVYDPDHPTDIQIGTVTVVSDGKRKTVEEAGVSTPTALWAIELVIDAQANRIRKWKKRDP